MRWLFRFVRWVIRARAGMPDANMDRPAGVPDFAAEFEVGDSDPTDTVPTLSGDQRDDRPRRPPSKYPPGRRPP